jgi:hypothetical protein
MDIDEEAVGLSAESAIRAPACAGFVVAGHDQHGRRFAAIVAVRTMMGAECWVQSLPIQDRAT